MSIKKIFLCIVLLNYVYIGKSFSQEITLKSTKQKEQGFLNSINFNKEVKDSTQLFYRLNKISQKLKKEGFLFHTLDSLILNSKNYAAYFSLQQKTDSIIIKVNQKNAKLLKNSNISRNEIKLDLSHIENFNNKITQILEQKGYSFSKIKLQNFRTKRNSLVADLKIETAKERTIDKIVYRDYINFPEKFATNYLNINRNSIFNQKKVEDISRLSKNLNFIEEIKSPEVLFKKDSTLIYLYLKKKQNNSFDGLINFNSTDNGKLEFNGHLDLKLNNVINSGENFELFWNSLGNTSQELLVNVRTPYIFNTKITPDIRFELFKQDSTFINTKLSIQTAYQIKENTSISLSFDTENSNITTLTENLDNFNSLFFGLGYNFKIPNDSFFSEKKLSLNISGKYGQRITSQSTNQIQITSDISYLINFKKRSAFYLHNKSSLLNSNTLLKNELFRIGGINSIRGFNNKSIFTDRYSVQNIEYRYLTSQTSYVYSITDIALTVQNKQQEQLYGLGLGYTFATKNSKIDISAVAGNNTKQTINFNSTQLLINWKTYF